MNFRIGTEASKEYQENKVSEIMTEESRLKKKQAWRCKQKIRRKCGNQQVTDVIYNAYSTNSRVNNIQKQKSEPKDVSKKDLFS